jgi:hypothetical protein
MRRGIAYVNRPMVRPANEARLQYIVRSSDSEKDMSRPNEIENTTAKSRPKTGGKGRQLKPLSELTNGQNTIAQTSSAQTEIIETEQEDDEFGEIEKALDIAWADSGM